MIEHEICIRMDPWVASSVLQKAIRRGDIEFGLRAAETLYRQRGNAVWRRLIIIAFEDIGIGDLDLVSEVTHIANNQRLRDVIGGELQIIRDLTARLAEAPKDRSTDYLICAAADHPDWARDRQAVASLPSAARISLAFDRTQSVVRRAQAAASACGVNGEGAQRLFDGDLPGLLKAFEERGLPPQISSAVQIAARLSREPITIMLPLIWAELNAAAQPPVVVEVPMPDPDICFGIPLYAFDKHTRVGKQAISIFARENATVNETLAAYVQDFQAADIANMAAFYVDAIPVARRVDWTLSQPLGTLGLEVDMIKVGCPKAGAIPIVEAVRTNLDHLNAIRRQLLSRPGRSGKPRLARSAGF